MKTISCLFLACLVVFAAAESGLKLTITPKAIGAFKDQYLPQVVAKLQNLEIPPITAGGLTVSNFTLKQLSLPSGDLNVQFTNNKVALASSSFGVQAKFHIDYTLWSFIPISTTLEVSTNQSTSQLVVSIENEHLLHIHTLNVQILNLDVSFPDAYLGPVYHGLMYVLTWPIEYILSQIINSSVKTALQTILDQAVASLPGFITLPSTNIGVDYQITNVPKITPNYLTIYINGTFYDSTTNFTVPPVAAPRDYDEFDNASGHHVQAFVSEYVFNTAFYEVFQKGMMKINVTNDMMPPEAGIKFGTKWLKQFIPNINNYFNESDNVTLQLDVPANPITTISKNTMKVKVPTKLGFNYVNGTNVTKIVELQSILEVNANISLANWTMKPYIVNATFATFDVLQSNVGDITGDKFQQGFNILFLFAIGGFNSQFKPIELPKVPGVSLESSVVTFEEGHIRIQSSPSYPLNSTLVLPSVQRSLRSEKI